MKNLKSTEPIYLNGQHGWCADIYEGEKSSVETDICTVWGSSEEELNYRVTMIKKAYETQEALKESKLQIEYLHEKFSETGSGNAMINKIESIIKEIKL